MRKLTNEDFEYTKKLSYGKTEFSGKLKNIKSDYTEREILLSIDNVDFGGACALQKDKTFDGYYYTN